MAHHKIYTVAEEENAALRAELLNSSCADLFRAYLRSLEVMEMYREASDISAAITGASSLAGWTTQPRGMSSLQNSYATTIAGLAGGNTTTTMTPAATWTKTYRASKSPPRNSEAARVTAYAEAYLMATKTRRTSTQIAEALVKGGIDIAGDDMTTKAARVSAHLSSAKDRFDNDRSNGGYGLTAWAEEMRGTYY